MGAHVMEILKRIWNGFDERTGISGLVEPLAQHLVPPGANWWYVFGSATLFAFVLQVVTGIVLAASYVASADEAYQSLQFISNDALFGKVLRGMHFFGASAMVLFVGVHMVRILLTGSFKFPREINWLSGSVLLLLTLGAAFTGQLLRWDQNAVWTAIVGAEQAGRAPLVGKFLARFILAGETLGGATLSRFFALHVFLIPGAIIAVVGFHLYLVLKNGISEPPQVGQPVDPNTYRRRYEALLKREGRPFWPDAAWRDVVFAVIMIMGIVLLAVVVGPPALTKPPDPSIVDAYPRPDWYFLWYFAVLALIPPALEPYVIIGAPLLLGIGLLALPFVANRGERHPLRRPWVVTAVLVAVMIIGVLWRLGAAAPWSPDFTAQPLPQEVVGETTGPVQHGAQLFHQKGCEYCHTVSSYGGQRGPNLTTIGDRLTPEQMTIRILNGGINMPAFGGDLTPEELNALIAFLESRRAP
jgi:ubiquinol-cytochrome c reductase cytochrome b subunit